VARVPEAALDLSTEHRCGRKLQGGSHRKLEQPRRSLPACGLDGRQPLAEEESQAEVLLHLLMDRAFFLIKFGRQGCSDIRQPIAEVVLKGHVAINNLPQGLVSGDLGCYWEGRLEHAGIQGLPQITVGTAGKPEPLCCARLGAAHDVGGIRVPVSNGTADQVQGNHASENLSPRNRLSTRHSAHQEANRSEVEITPHEITTI